MNEAKAPRRALRKQERQRRIIAELRGGNAVRIAELADEFHVSTETVRRDLDEMGEQGLINRTYGGAVAMSTGREPGVRERGAAHVRERERIARRAAELVRDGDVLMIDAGSTTAHFARRLAVDDRELTVITNAMDVASALAEASSVRVLVCPGYYSGRENAAFGADALEYLGRFHADHAFIGASGLSSEGPSDVDLEASWVKRRMIERARSTALLADHSKLGQAYLHLVCPPASLALLITDLAPEGELAEALREAEVGVLVA
jgi:DeoR/GlpR family transcriptional regulator of sugar metabolism